MRPGYKQTEVGFIPADWKVSALGEIGDTLIGLTYRPNQVRDHGTLVLRSSNIQDWVLCFDDNVYVDADIPDRIMVRPGDILICVRNGSRDLIGKSALLDERTVGMTFGAFMAVFRSPLGQLINYLFQSNVLKRQITEHLGATINQITNASLNSFRIPLPPSETERNAITAALSDVDSLLASLDSLIAKKRDLKQAAMQQLLTGQTRLPGFQGEWEMRLLPDLADIRSGGTPSTNDPSAWGGHVFLDEFQDCTNAQYELIKACFQDTTVRLTAVGDTKQRIMGWAGALEGIFESFAEDFDAHPLNLYQNFRSKPRLRRMQNAMVRVMDPPAALDDSDLPGDEGEIELLRFDNDDDEASALADLVRVWIEDEGVNPSEIAVLVSKQQNLYCQKLRAALDAKGVPYRDEDATQNLASEPVANLIVDFLLIAAGQRQPGPFQRLLDLVVFGRGLDQENEYRARSRWNRHIAAVKQRLVAEEADLAEVDTLRTIVDEMLDIVGRDVLVGLSPEYAQGDYLQQQVDATIARVHSLLEEGEDATTALASFSGDRAVRIMSIHKSKGLEYDTVVVLGVEGQTFWGEQDAERSAFFVGISRAKRRLYLTVCEEREQPEGAPRYWKVARTEHDEFVGYATPYL